MEVPRGSVENENNVERARTQSIAEQIMIAAQMKRRQRMEEAAAAQRALEEPTQEEKELAGKAHREAAVAQAKHEAEAAYEPQRLAEEHPLTEDELREFIESDFDVAQGAALQKTQEKIRVPRQRKKPIAKPAAVPVSKKTKTLGDWWNEFWGIENG